jgi:hypothetical protein
VDQNRRIVTPQVIVSDGTRSDETPRRVGRYRGTAQGLLPGRRRMWFQKTEYPF